VEAGLNQLVTMVETDHQSVVVKRLRKRGFQTQMKIPRESFGDADFLE